MTVLLGADAIAAEPFRLRTLREQSRLSFHGGPLPPNIRPCCNSVIATKTALQSSPIHVVTEAGASGAPPLGAKKFMEHSSCRKAAVFAPPRRCFVRHAGADEDERRRRQADLGARNVAAVNEGCANLRAAKHRQTFKSFRRAWWWWRFNHFRSPTPKRRFAAVQGLRRGGRGPRPSFCKHGRRGPRAPRPSRNPRSP